MSPDIHVLDLLAGPNLGHVATRMDDGAPHTAPVWIDLDGDRPIFFKLQASVGYRNLRRDPRLAISIVAHDDPYRAAYMRGRVADFRLEPEAGEWLRAQALAYIGVPYPEPIPGPGALMVVEVERAAFRQIQMRHIHS